MLKVVNLTAGYGNVIILRNISFIMEEGKILTVIGPNGAGKSSLLWALSGLIRPKSGKVLFKGNDITGWPSRRILALGIGHVIQGMHVFGELTVEDNLILGAFGQNFNIKDLRVRQLPRIYNYFPILKNKESQLAGSLSGGEKQMLAIGRALMPDPKLLILDEPSAGLAPLLVQRLFELLDQLRKEFSLTTLLVEQNAGIALRFADRALVLAQGQVAIEDEAKNLINSEKVKEFYLGKGLVNSQKSI